ncbi:hypothetical protein [Streptomyces sp. 3N207]|uniref:hypothetical protein n=1 Tax=Streptomyces sp. 3N207 TaxID=3457417 RepID=UPI003FD59EB5
MNTTWQFLVEQNEPSPDILHRSIEVLGACTGTREQALAALEVQARAYEPEHPWNPRGVEFYQVPDGFVRITESRRNGRRWTCRFLLAELLYDGPLPVPPIPQPPTAPPRPPSPPGGP